MWLQITDLKSPSPQFQHSIKLNCSEFIGASTSGERGLDKCNNIKIQNMMYAHSDLQFIIFQVLAFSKLMALSKYPFYVSHNFSIPIVLCNRRLLLLGKFPHEFTNEETNCFQTVRRETRFIILQHTDAWNKRVSSAKVLFWHETSEFPVLRYSSDMKQVSFLC